MKPLEKRVHDHIVDELVHELARHEEGINCVFSDLIRRAEFMSMKYKDQESYNRIVELKRMKNILNCMFKLK